MGVAQKCKLVELKSEDSKLVFREKVLYFPKDSTVHHLKYACYACSLPVVVDVSI